MRNETIPIALLFGAVLASPAAGQTLPPGPGQAIVQRSCVSCHTLDQVLSQHRTADQWADIVNQMISNGAQISDAEYDAVVDYLAANFGPAAAPRPAP